MSEDKKYSELEVALLIKERLQELVKSSNSSHEIDGGEEPNNDLAECPEYLANSLSEQGSQEGSEFASSEAPSEGSSEEEYDEEGKPKKKKKEGEESDESEKAESDVAEGSEEYEPEYEYKKSEAGMHNIVYKSLKKGNFATNSGGAAAASKGFGSLLGGGSNPAPAPTATPTPTVGKSEEKGPDNAEIGHATKAPTKMSNAQNITYGSSIRSGRKGSMKGHKADPSPGQIKGEAAAKARRIAMKNKSLNKEEVKSTAGMATPPHKSDKGMEEVKGIKRPMEKALPQAAGKIAEFKQRVGKSEKLSNFLKNKK